MFAATLYTVIFCSPRGWLALVAAWSHSWAQAQSEVNAHPQLALAATASPSMQSADVDGDARLRLIGWSGPGPEANMGVSLGFTAPSQRMPADTLQPPAGLDLGLQWRSADPGLRRVRIGLWQHISPMSYPNSIASQINPPVNYNTRLEMQFSAASARGIQFELGGALGWQLNSNEKVVLRISRGRPMVFYRLKF